LPDFIFEPQGQILYQHVSFGQANDGLGDVGLGGTTSETGRLGLRGQWSIPGSYGELWQPYVRGDLWRDWGGGATTSFSGEAVPLVEQGRGWNSPAG
jgi:outer membrane autotransporter protein